MLPSENGFPLIFAERPTTASIVHHTRQSGLVADIGHDQRQSSRRCCWIIILDMLASFRPQGTMSSSREGASLEWHAWRV